jgi:hypothetical protein
LKRTVTKPAGLRLILAALLVVVLVGCGDERLVQTVQDADRRQAQQNNEIARVCDDATVVRQQVAKLQNDLRDDQAAIGRERDRLEAERRQIASQRPWAELYSPLLEAIGVVAVVVAVLTYCSMLVHSLRRNGPADAVLADSLVQQLLSVEQLPPPTLLPPADVGPLPIARIADARRNRA